ncbi:MAG: hypothetical protein M9905_02805 [Rhizobiaceae bacterium]|nr:hypothetical protein [Rhizobiaceae bacterium]
MAIDLDPADYALFWRKPARREGMLVAICGFDGTGKTTQVERLQGTLEGRGVTVTRTRQPTDWYRNEPVVKSYLAHGTAADGRLLTLPVGGRPPPQHRRGRRSGAGRRRCRDLRPLRVLHARLQRRAGRRYTLSIVRYNVDIPKPDLIIIPRPRAQDRSRPDHEARQGQPRL